MVFSSHVFIFAFLPLVLLGYYLLPRVVSGQRLRRAQNLFLIAASLFFYGYFNVSYLLLIAASILVNYALERVERGMSASGIASELERAKAHATVMGVVDTLEYLHRGGRISKTVAVLGGALSIKPVLRVTDGEVAMIGKARGSKNSNNFLIQETSKCGVNYEMPICLGYTGLSDELLQRYIADSRQLWEGKVKELPISTVGATIGTHVGPGAVVVAFFDTRE